MSTLLLVAFAETYVVKRFWLSIAKWELNRFSILKVTNESLPRLKLEMKTDIFGISETELELS